MPPILKPIPPNVFLLADHLDSVLASADELLAMRIHVGMETRGEAEPASAGLKSFVDRARTLEMSILSRTLQARARASELRGQPAHIRPLLSLFVSGTAPLADAVEDLADRSYADFQTGNCPLAYLRSRGVITADHGSLLGMVELEIGDEFLIAKRIALGPFTDLAAQFLGSLTTCYDLFRSAAILSDLSDDLEEVASGAAAETHTSRA